MVYSHAMVRFDEGNIINLKGYNSSGKSSLIKAVAVALMDLFPSKQVRLIKHGEDYFRVIVTFDDGVSIVRDKYVNGQSLYEMYKDRDLVFTTKVGNRLGKVSGVPEEIQNYLALCKMEVVNYEGSPYLNYQSRQDKLWLVETKGSENYASLNEILRTEDIVRAVKLLNTDRNRLISESNAIEADLNAIENQLDAVQGLDERHLLALEDREQAVGREVNKYKGLKTISGIADVVKTTRVHPEVHEVDIHRYSELVDIASDAKSLSTLKPIPLVEGIKSEQLDEVNRLGKLAINIEKSKLQPELQGVDGRQLSVLDSIAKVAQEVKVLEGTITDEIQAIPMSLISRLESIISTVSDLNSAMSTMAGIKSDIKLASSKLAKIVATAEKEGKRFVECENCHSYVEVNLNEA